MGSDDDGAAWINDRSADASGRLFKRLPRNRGRSLPFRTRRGRLLRKLCEAGRRPTQGGKRKKDESKPEVEGHE